MKQNKPKDVLTLNQYMGDNETFCDFMVAFLSEKGRVFAVSPL